MRHLNPALLIAGATTMLFAAEVASAKPVTKYVHYLVAGPSAQSLYTSMLRNGPHVGGNRAYASISMAPRITAYFQQGTSSCSIANFAIDASFTIRLPELKQGAKLSPEVRKSFAAFYAFAKRHEETHRSIWLKCAGAAETAVNNITAKNCDEANRRALAVIEKMNRCREAKDVAFDNAEQLRLAKHPFIKQALARVKPGRAALLANASKTKKK